MNVGELKNVAGTYEDVHEFLDDVHSIVDPDNGEDDDNRVKLMTMHAAKGREFRLVFIIDANAGVVPSWRCEKEEDIQEERRLFYVAMTRAKENLVILSPKKMMRRDGLVEVPQSMFINQISDKHIQSENRAS